MIDGRQALKGIADFRSYEYFTLFDVGFELGFQMCLRLEYGYKQQISTPARRAIGLSYARRCAILLNRFIYVLTLILSAEEQE